MAVPVILPDVTAMVERSLQKNQSSIYQPSYLRQRNPAQCFSERYKEVGRYAHSFFFRRLEAPASETWPFRTVPAKIVLIVTRLGTAAHVQ